VTASSRVIAFDVNETLLDLGALDPLFERAFGSAGVRAQWFGQMLQIAFTGGLTGNYVDFSTAQAAALEMVAAAHDVTLEADTRAEVRDGMRTLPPHPDADTALARLHDSPLQVVALTNSPLDVARAQLSHARLDRHFHAILSADEVQALKPRREAYALVAARCEVPLADVRLVAAHAWDVTGALAAGCAAAFVLRPGKLPTPIGPQPDIVGHDLTEVADAILAGVGRP
jgi:2-haloacid dehalogenase